jgi:outer membrane protein OmpA-like peptidoglycan-associated protein
LPRKDDGVESRARSAGLRGFEILPKIPACRIDNCEKQDSDLRDILVGEDYKGDAISVSMDGNSRSVMYECWAGTTPASIVEKAEIALRAAGFDVPYRFGSAEASLTARKDDLWITVEAASRFYTLTEIDAGAPDFEFSPDADAIAEMMDRWGRVPLSGVQFQPGKADLLPASVTILDEVAKLLRNHPSWHLRVEGHTDNVGSKTANLNLSFFRASAVVAWLAANGIKRARLDPKGMGDTHPVAENETERGGIGSPHRTGQDRRAARAIKTAQGLKSKLGRHSQPRAVRPGRRRAHA